MDFRPTTADLVYGEDLPCTGPIYRSMTVDGGRVRLHFGHIDGSLMARDGAVLEDFAVAGTDQIFHWAQTEIDGEMVVVHSSGVPEPVAVRYARAANPLDDVGRCGI